LQLQQFAITNLMPNLGQYEPAAAAAMNWLRRVPSLKGAGPTPVSESNQSRRISGRMMSLMPGV
jgi:hypothetical protein